MTLNSSSRRSGWRTRDIARGTVIVLAVYAACRLVYAAHLLIFVAFLGTLLGLAVSSGADRLQRWHIPRAAGAGLIVVGAVAILAGFGAWTGPTVRSQYRDLKQRLPEALAKLDNWIGQQQGGLIGTLLSEEQDSTQVASSTQQNTDTLASPDGQSSDSLSNLKAIKQRIVGQMSGVGRYFFPVIHSTIAALGGIVLVFFLAIYTAASPEVYRRGILALIPKRAQARWEQVLATVATALRRWLTTQLVAMIAIGAVTTGALLLLHVRAALPLGILAGLLEFVPTIGPILSAVPSVAMAFVDSPGKAAAVGLAYVGIQFLENHLLIPLLMKEGVDIPPVLTILTQATMALVFGVMGLFIAVPLLVLAMVLVKMLYVEDVLGNSTALQSAERPPPAEAR